jgi:hypothetical protein
MEYLLLTVLLAGCTSSPQFFAERDLQIRKSLDLRICTNSPKNRPHCLFEENDLRRMKRYQTDAKYAKQYRELLDIYERELEQDIDKMIDSSKGKPCRKD